MTGVHTTSPVTQTTLVQQGPGDAGTWGSCPAQAAATAGRGTRSRWTDGEREVQVRRDSNTAACDRCLHRMGLPYLSVFSTEGVPG